VPRIVPFIVPTTAQIAPGAVFELRPTLAFSETYTDNFNLTAENKVQDFDRRSLRV
jgi:hypothetical protein